RGERDLPTRRAVRLEDHHAVPALGEYAGGLEPGGTRADDDRRATGRRRTPDVVRQLPLATGRGVVDALRRARLVDGVDAVARADARADPVLLAGRELAHQVR